MIEIDQAGYRLFLAGCFFLAYVHAYRKLSPYFAATWFGAALLFAYRWSGSGVPELLLLPGVVFYLAAAATKGLVETRERWQGNHPLHVVITGLFSGVVALPVLASADAMGWPARPGSSPGMPWLDGIPSSWLGGVPGPQVGLWVVAGLVFYGAYKILDHMGLGKPLQTVLVFVVAPLLVPLVELIVRG